MFYSIIVSLLPKVGLDDIEGTQRLKYEFHMIIISQHIINFVIGTKLQEIM